MYLLNNSRRWTEGAKGELNVPTQNSTFSRISKTKNYAMQDYYVIKTENRLFSSTVHASQLTKVYSRSPQYSMNTSQTAVGCDQNVTVTY